MRDILLSRDNLLSPTKELGPFSRDVKSDYYYDSGILSPPDEINLLVTKEKKGICHVAPVHR